MRSTLFLLLLTATQHICFGQSKSDLQEIYEVLELQTNAWNEGNISRFMKGYWNSDSLMFVGGSGITYGYRATLANYLKRYPDKETMGVLKFDVISLTFPSKEVAFLVGKFHLTRPEKGDASGYYTLLWKKIEGKWYITVDHTS